jgi:uncharacterized membrane protein SirB2
LSLLDFYVPVRAAHIGAVAASGGLFALRGLGAIGGARWPQRAPLRYLSYAIDTLLLSAALMLWTMLPGALFANHWLAVKLALVVAYIALGSLALRRAPTLRLRALCYLAALLVFAWIVGIARTHQPLGWLTLLHG